ncbi:MAG: hypothetical protein JWM98_2010 [Thermoleophilia bacterium]|nr:hypothetical protein [Thermoleophilia bacterium]
MAASPCAHLASIQIIEGPDEVDGCDTCLAEGGHWVHLRMCMTCGEVGCCDSSPGQHARKHAEQESHPVIRSIEPGEWWSYCFVDDATFHLASAEPVKELPRSINHNKDAGRMELWVGSDQVAWLTYEPIGDAINIVSTGVKPGNEGLDYEGALVLEAVEEFGDLGKQLIPSDEFARAYIAYRPERHTSVVASMRARMLGEDPD